MVKQQKVPAGAVGIPVSARSKSCRRRKRPTHTQALKMLSEKQSEAEPGAETSDKNNGEAGTSSNDGGAVTSGGSIVNGKESEEFLSTGRTGRRNAMPYIHSGHADTGTADLPKRLEALTTDPADTGGVKMGVLKMAPLQMTNLSLTPTPE